LGRSLNQVDHIRLLADYTGEAIDREQGQWAVERARVFVLAIQQGHAGHWRFDQGAGERSD